MSRAPTTWPGYLQNLDQHQQAKTTAISDIGKLTDQQRVSASDTLNGAAARGNTDPNFYHKVLDATYGSQPGMANTEPACPDHGWRDCVGHSCDWANQALRGGRYGSANAVQQQSDHQVRRRGDTGKGASYLSNFTGGLAGVNWTSDKAANLAQMQHYLSLQQSQLAQQAGLSGTDACSKIAGAQAGSAEQPAEAINGISRVNRALSTGVGLYNQGVENAYQQSGPFAVRDIRNKWSSAADVDVLRLYDAVKNKTADPQGLVQAVQSLDGPNSPQYKGALSNIDKIRAVIGGREWLLTTISTLPQSTAPSRVSPPPRRLHTHQYGTTTPAL